LSAGYDLKYGAAFGGNKIRRKHGFGKARPF